MAAKPDTALPPPLLFLPAVELLAAGPSIELVLPPPPSPEVLSTLSRFLAQALPPVLSSLQASAPRNEVERALEELLRTLRLVGPLPAFKVCLGHC